MAISVITHTEQSLMIIAFLLVFVVYIFRRRRRILVVSFVVMITAVTGYTLKDGVELKGVVDERGKEKRGGDVTVPLPLPLLLSMCTRLAIKQFKHILLEGKRLGVAYKLLQLIVERNKPVFVDVLRHCYIVLYYVVLLFEVVVRPHP